MHTCDVLRDFMDIYLNAPYKVASDWKPRWARRPSPWKVDGKVGGKQLDRLFNQCVVAKMPTTWHGGSEKFICYSITLIPKVCGRFFTMHFNSFNAFLTLTVKTFRQKFWRSLQNVSFYNEECVLHFSRRRQAAQSAPTVSCRVCQM